MYPPPKSGRRILAAAGLSALHAVIGIGGGLFVLNLTSGPFAAAIAAVVGWQVAVAMAIYVVFVRPRSAS